MRQGKLIPMELFYLGDRDYIDISQVADQALHALQLKHSEVANFSLKIHSPIMSQCFLSECPVDRPAATVKFEFCGKQHRYFISGTNRQIDSRSQEKEIDTNQIFQFHENTLSIVRWPEGVSITTLFRLAGKVFVREMYGVHYPRAVKFECDKFYDRAQFTLFECRQIKPKARDFIIMSTFYDGIEFGRVYIFLNSLEET